MVKQKQAAAFPLLLPLTDNKNKPVVNAHRLVFVGTLIIYYSYQHPIAFTCKDKLYVRSDFWERRRGRRLVHIKYILQDVGNVPGTKETIISDSFFEHLQRELAATGATFLGGQRIETMETKTTQEKRRVRL